MTVADNMVIGTVLPYIHAVFLVTKSFKRRYESRRNGILYCRDRRPRRSVSRAFYPQHNVDMIGHDHITFNGQIIVKVAQLTDVFISDLSVFCQFDLRTVEDAGPYNTRKNAAPFFRAYREKHGLIPIIVRTFQPSGLAIFQFVHFHHPSPLYHKSAEKTRVIFRLRRSDIIAAAIVILKPCGFSDILFASKTCVANITRREPNITAYTMQLCAISLAIGE